ncbi:MAG: hypothetical protein AB7Q16_06015 [Vicinamibacterales bacterium]
MLLRTLAGSRAGQIEDYDYPAAMTVLRHGFAKRLDGDVAQAPPPETRLARTVDRPPPAPERSDRRSRRWRR